MSKVIVIGKAAANGLTGDIIARHLTLAEEIRNICPTMSTELISIGKKSQKIYRQIGSAEFKITVLNPIHRSLFGVYLAFYLFCFLAKEKDIKTVTVQEVWEEGLIAFLFTKIVGAVFVPQVHLDMFHEHWLKEAKINRIKLFISKKLLARSSKIRVTSRELRTRMMETLKIEGEKIAVLPIIPKIPVPSISRNKVRAEVGVGKDNFMVCFAGRVVKQKRLETWVRIVEQALCHFEDVNFLIIVIHCIPHISWIRSV